MLNNINTKVKCDCYNCKNDAAASFALKGRASRCNLCAECINALGEDILSRTAPKSPKNTIRRLEESRRKDRNQEEI